VTVKGPHDASLVKNWQQADKEWELRLLSYVLVTVKGPHDASLLKNWQRADKE
jgi:hypothetical protein